MVEEREVELEPVGGGAVCFELADLLLQGLLLPLACGMAVAVEVEDNDAGGTRPEAAAGMLVVEEEEEEPVALTPGTACSVMDEGREVKPSEESASQRRHKVRKG